MTDGRDNASVNLPSGAAFHEAHAASWSAGYGRAGFSRRRQTLLALLEHRVLPGQHWLDLGCGSGVLSAELLRLGARVTAVDGSPAMLAAACAALSADAPVTLLQSDVTHLTELADNTYDGVLCSSVIEYIEMPDALLSEAARILRPGGRLILSVPPTWSALRSAQKLIRRLYTLFRRDKFAYLGASRFEIAPGCVKKWLGAHGLTVESVIGFDPLMGAGWGPLRPSLIVIDACKALA